jgi:hypothetical protein
MNSTRFDASLSLFATASAATFCRRVHEAFRDFVPPFLLCSRPDFLFTAIDAAKWSIEVVSPSDEIRSAVAVVRREQLRIHDNKPVRHMFEFNGFRHRVSLNRSPFSRGYDFRSPLFAAFHGNFVMTQESLFDFTVGAVD